MRSEFVRQLLIPLLLLGTAGCRPVAAEAPDGGRPGPAPAVEQPRDPSTLVLVHSWSGRTAQAGAALAQMLGAALVRIGDPPQELGPAAPATGPALDEVLAHLSLAGVQRLYLGFPIYSEAPSSTAVACVQALALQGVRVTPFYTFDHKVQQKSLDDFAQLVRERGGEPTDPIGLLLPMAAPPELVQQRMRAAFLARRALWAATPQPAHEEDCSDAPQPHGGRMCRDPGGLVWVGDTAPEGLVPGAPAPQLERVAPFEIDQAEVTVGQYRRCVQAGGCRAIAPNDFSKTLIADGGDESPMPEMALGDARAYCAWAGLRLPTEAEWTHAARGDDVRSYPWGAQFDVEQARGNVGEKPSTGFASYAPVPESTPWPSDGFRGLAPGCRFPAGKSPFGVCDLAGNLAEWVEPRAGEVAPLEGGSWMDGEAWAFAIAARLPLRPLSLGTYFTGFRCARSLP